jgi:hypothetical protein
MPLRNLLSLVTRHHRSAACTLNNTATALTALRPSTALTFKRQFSSNLYAFIQQTIESTALYICPQAKTPHKPCSHPRTVFTITEQRVFPIVPCHDNRSLDLSSAGSRLRGFCLLSCSTLSWLSFCSKETRLENRQIMSETPRLESNKF